MRVLVTGSTGFVGRRLIRWLDGSGVEAVPLVRHATGALGEVAIGDLAKPAALTLPKADALVHLAARVHVMDERDADPLTAYRRVNVEGTRKLLEAARNAGISRFVFVSTIKVLGEDTASGSVVTQDSLPDPRDPYAVSKLEAEQLVMQFCREHGLEWTIVRPVLVFGPGAGANFGQLMRLVARQIPLPLAAIRNARSFLYVDNLNAFLAEATRHPYLVGRSVNLADPPALSTPELIRKLSAAMGRRAVLLPVPPTLLEWAGALAGRTDAIRRITGSLQVDTDRLFEEMPWKPPVPWDEALRETTADVRRR